MPLYFAYGANLDRVAMAQRCPRSAALGPARLDHHRFIIMADGYATVIPASGAVVHGLLWDVPPDDLPALDDFEEVEAGLYRRTTLPITVGERDRHAAAYLAASVTPGVPCPGYMEAVLAAAEACGLPAPYRAELRTWLIGI